MDAVRVRKRRRISGLGASDCERISEGFLAQPCNAVTSLGLVASGAWWTIGSLRARSRRPQRIVFGASVAATGLGSWLYHGPQPRGAKTLHDLSILVVLSQVAYLELMRDKFGLRLERRASNAALATLSLGIAAHALGRTSSPLCDPDSPVQLHGLWHLGAALSLAAYGRASFGDPTR